MVNTYIFKMSVGNVYITKWTTPVTKLEGFKILKVCQKLRLCLRGRDLRVPWWNKWKWFLWSGLGLWSKLRFELSWTIQSKNFEFCSRTIIILSSGFCARKNLFWGCCHFFQLIINLWKLQIQIHWVVF